MLLEHSNSKINLEISNKANFVQEEAYLTIYSQASLWEDKGSHYKPQTEYYLLP